MKKQYELRSSCIEIPYKKRNEIKQGVTFANEHNHDQNPCIIKIFTDKDEALKALAEYKTGLHSFISSAGLRYSVTEYYIEENIYDDDNEFVEGGDIWAFSEMEIELIEKPSFETIGTYKTMADAIRAEENYDGENEVYISF